MLNWIALHWDYNGRLWRIVVLYAGDKQETVYESISPADLESLSDDMIKTLPDDLHFLRYVSDATDAYTYVYVHPTYYNERINY